MTKSELIGKLAESGDLTKKQADLVLNTLVDSIVKTVRKGDALKIPNLGTFRRRNLKARMGRNPQTGVPIKIPARKKVAFTAAKTFKEAVLGTAKK